MDSADSWREAHAHLTLAVAAARDAVASERTKRRFLLEEICSNISIDGDTEADFVPGSCWSRAATKAATAARRAKAAAAAGGGSSKKRYSASSTGTGGFVSTGLKKGMATALAKQRRDAVRQKAKLGHCFDSSEEDEDLSLKEFRGAPSTGVKRAPLKKRKKAALAAAAAVADELAGSGTSEAGGKKKSKKIRLSLSAARAKPSTDDAAAEDDNVSALMQYSEPQGAASAAASGYTSASPYGAPQPPSDAPALRLGGYSPAADNSYASTLYPSAMTEAAAAPSAYSTPTGDVTHLQGNSGGAAPHQQPSTVEDLLAQYGEQEDPPDSF